MKRVFWEGLPYRCGPIWGMFIITLSPLDVLACPHLGETDPPKILSVIFLGFSPRCGQAITSIGDFDIFKLFTIYYLPTCLLSIDYVLFTTQLFNWLLEAFFLGGLPYRCGQAITSIGDFEIVMNY